MVSSGIHSGQCTHAPYASRSIYNARQSISVPASVLPECHSPLVDGTNKDSNVRLCENEKPADKDEDRFGEVGRLNRNLKVVTKRGKAFLPSSRPFRNIAQHLALCRSECSPAYFPSFPSVRPANRAFCRRDTPTFSTNLILLPARVSCIAYISGDLAV